MERSHVLSVLVRNHFGVLSRVAGLFSRRGYNIDSLSVGETDHPDKSRMTIVVRGDENILEQIESQLLKLVEVIDITGLTGDNAVLREHVLIKVEAEVGVRSSIIEIANIFRASVVDVSPSSLALELTGSPSKITAFCDNMKQYVILDLVRTGVTGLMRG